MTGVTLHSHVHYKVISLHVQWTPVLLSEALLERNVYVHPQSEGSTGVPYS